MYNSHHVSTSTSSSSESNQAISTPTSALSQNATSRVYFASRNNDHQPNSRPLTQVDTYPGDKNIFWQHSGGSPSRYDPTPIYASLWPANFGLQGFFHFSRDTSTDTSDRTSMTRPHNKSTSTRFTTTPRLSRRPVCRAFFFFHQLAR